MNTKYFEHIVVYLSVLVVCVIIALFARVVALRLGVDEFTATVIFWIVTGVGIILYSALMLLIDGLFTAIVKKFSLTSICLHHHPKKRKKLSRIGTKRV
mgnify:CR=1 FL=1